MGYPLNVKGYKCYDLETKQIFVSRDVFFTEEVFPFSEPTKMKEKPIIYTPDTYHTDDNSFNELPVHRTKQIIHNENEHYTDQTNEELVSPIDHTDHTNNIGHTDQIDHSNNHVSESIPPSPIHQTTEEVSENDHSINDQNLRRSKRKISTPQKLKHFQHYSVPKTTNANLVHSTHYPIDQYIGFDRLSPKHKAYALHLSELHEPTTYEEAVHHKHWRDAIRTELIALNEDNTWTITPLPHGIKPVSCKYVFKTKLNSNGEIERHKARLVAKGFTQTYGIDYTETFSLVAKLTIV